MSRPCHGPRATHVLAARHEMPPPRACMQIEPMYLFTQLSTVFIYVGVCSVLIHFFILRVMRYASRVYRESVGEVITVEGVPAREDSTPIVSCARALTDH